MVTDQFLLGRHGAPSTLSLILHGTLGDTVTKVGSDDGAGGLHVQEVGGQGTLGCIGIMLALLALLLLLHDGDGSGGGNWDTGNLRQRLCRKHVGNVCETGIILKESGLPDQQVGLAEVVCIGRADELLDGSQTMIDLWVALASSTECLP